MRNAMKLKSPNPLLRRFFMIATLALAAWGTVPQAARAQGVVVLVNGDPITDVDIEQRTKLQTLSGQKGATRQQVVEELINEKLKIQLLKRYAIPDVDKDVDNAMTNMARRMRQNSREFSDQLSKQGVQIDTLKSRMKADIIWQQLVRGRFQASFQFNDKDIQQRLQAKHPEGVPATAAYDYTLRPILFIVPRGSPGEAFAARAKEAEALRAEFQNCDEGVSRARGMRFVAVRPPVVKNSAELPAALRDILTKTEIGRLTPPETTQQGVEVYAVCSRKNSDNTPEKKEIRDQLYNETFEKLSKDFLKEIRSQAMIEYKQAKP
jgi:peptidyl-prolyl cis-trans isomerase SurA